MCKEKNRIIPINLVDIPVATCSIFCYNKVIVADDIKNAQASKKKNGSVEEAAKIIRMAWDNDHDDPEKTSMAFILEWILVEGNYKAYRGGSGGGKTKVEQVKLLAERINASGVKVERSAKDVVQQIGKIENMYRNAVDWQIATGRGSESPGEIEDELKKRCKYFYQLQPIMVDRGNFRPLATYCHDMNDEVIDLSTGHEVVENSMKSPESDQSIKRLKPATAQYQQLQQRWQP